jgi:hypothetical protein
MLTDNELILVWFGRNNLNLVWFGSVLTVTSSVRTVRMTAGSSSALNVVSGEFFLSEQFNFQFASLCQKTYP